MKFAPAVVSGTVFKAGFKAGAKYICEHLTDDQVAMLADAEWNKNGVSSQTASAASPVAGVSAEKPETDWDERYRTMPATKCACGSKDIPAAIDGLQYYWQRHSRTGCTLELPNLTCWCGLKRSEHIDGHANPIVAQPSAEGDGKRALQVIQAALDESSKQYMSGIIGLSPAGTIHDALRREHLLAEGDGWIAFVCSLLPELDAAERLAQKVDRIHGLKLAFAIRKVSNRIIERAELPAPPSGQGEKERNEHLAS